VNAAKGLAARTTVMAGENGRGYMIGIRIAVLLAYVIAVPFLIGSVIGIGTVAVAYRRRFLLGGALGGFASLLVSGLIVGFTGFRYTLGDALICVGSGTCAALLAGINRFPNRQLTDVS